MPIQKTCTVCGKSYSVRPVHAESKYCSLKCCNTSPERRRLIRGWRKERLMQSCRECDGKFAVSPGQIKTKIFCSQKCHRRWRSRLHSGCNNPNWKGGTRNEKYPSEFYAIRASILALDGYQCAVPLCVTNDTRVSVHHIDFDKKNCSPLNLIAACPSCNSRANFDREIWRGILANVVKWRSDFGVMNIGFRGTMEIKP